MILKSCSSDHGSRFEGTGLMLEAIGLRLLGGSVWEQDSLSEGRCCHAHALGDSPSSIAKITPPGIPFALGYYHSPNMRPGSALSPYDTRTYIRETKALTLNAIVAETVIMS
jgi:hypothetical protein